jgi:hypothetical protein
MNGGKAKGLRRIAQQIFLAEKASGNENFKDMEHGKTVWMENTNRQKFAEQPDYTLMPELNDKGEVVVDNYGTTKQKIVEKLDDNGKPVMRKVLTCSGTITVHPACERGLYRRLKKHSKIDPKTFGKKLVPQKHVSM